MLFWADPTLPQVSFQENDPQGVEISGDDTEVIDLTCGGNMI